MHVSTRIKSSAIWPEMQFGIDLLISTFLCILFLGFPFCSWGWSGGAMVLGKLPVPGVLLIWVRVGQGPTALAVGMGCLDIFSLVYHFSFLSPSLWETARYRLKYCFKGPLSPKQPTNQPFCSPYSIIDYGYFYIHFWPNFNPLRLKIATTSGMVDWIYFIFYRKNSKYWDTQTSYRSCP